MLFTHVKQILHASYIAFFYSEVSQAKNLSDLVGVKITVYETGPHFIR